MCALAKRNVRAYRRVVFERRTDQRAVRTEDLLILANPGISGGPKDVELERQVLRAMFGNGDDRDLSTALVGLYLWLAAETATSEIRPTVGTGRCLGRRPATTW